MIDRISKFIENQLISVSAFEKSIHASDGMLRRAIKNGTDIQSKWITAISDNYPKLNIEWLITGKGEMINNPDVKFISENNNGDKRLIPFYDDVSTVGGVNSISASIDCNMPVSEWIDAGDWFHEATAAIRHYGDSMNEYPSGCILALKKVEDIRLILWGRNYCIETSEFRITKRIQKGDKDNYIAYSSNIDTYPDGHLIHEPIYIPKESIRNLYLVLGCVVKEYSSGAVSVKK